MRSGKGVNIHWRVKDMLFKDKEDTKLEPKVKVSPEFIAAKKRDLAIAVAAKQAGLTSQGGGI